MINYIKGWIKTWNDLWSVEDYVIAGERIELRPDEKAYFRFIKTISFFLLFVALGAFICAAIGFISMILK